MNNRQLILCVWSLVLGFCLALILISVVHAQDETTVTTYGCNALYTSNDPDVLSDYMVQLIGHQPVKTTLSSFVQELPCENLDVGRIIFNVCGITGDEHSVCTAWNNEFPLFYSEEFYYIFYSNSLLAANSSNKQSTEITQTIQDVPEINSQNNGFAINIVHIIIGLILLAGLGYVAYNRSMMKSTPIETQED